MPRACPETCAAGQGESPRGDQKSWRSSRANTSLAAGTLCLAVVMLCSQWTVPARGDVEEAMPITVRSPLPSEPETPEEMFRAVLVTVELGRPELARAYLEKFFEEAPTPELLLQLRDEFGPATFLKLSNIEDLQPLSTRLLELSNQALARFANDPARISQLIADLGGTSEEQVVAVTELRGAGIAVVPPLIRAIMEPAHVNHRDTILFALIRIGRQGIPALMGALRAPDAEVRASVIRVLGWVNAKEAIPFLWQPASSPAEDPDVRKAARESLAKLLGVKPGQGEIATTGVVSRLRKTAQEHFQLKHDWKVDAEGLVHLWDWSPEDETVAEFRLTPVEASSKVGMVFAKQALTLAPTDAEVQSTYLSLALASEARAAGWENPWPTGAGTAHDLALTVGADVVRKVVLDSLDSRQPVSAIAGLSVLAQIGNSKDLTARVNERSAILTALNFSDRRVQYAAATAVMQLDPQAKFPGSERVVEILARTISDGGEGFRRAIVIDSFVDRGTELIGMLREMGYEVNFFQTGREGFRAAAERSEVELVMMPANVIRWSLSETLANFRADARTSGIPIVIYADERSKSAVARHAKNIPLVAGIQEPQTTEDLERQVGPFLASLQSPPPTTAQSQAQASAAAYWLATISQGQRSKIFPLESAEPSLIAALENPDLAANAIVALGAVGTRATQARLAEFASDNTRTPENQEIAALQLTVHIQKYSLLISDEAILSLHAALQNASTPDLQSALGGVIGVLQPNAELVGKRLREFRQNP